MLLMPPPLAASADTINMMTIRTVTRDIHQALTPTVGQPGKPSTSTGCDGHLSVVVTAQSVNCSGVGFLAAMRGQPGVAGGVAAGVVSEVACISLLSPTAQLSDLHQTGARIVVSATAPVHSKSAAQ